MNGDQARRQVASAEDVQLERVRLLAIQSRQVGPTAKYIIDGKPGVHYRRLADPTQRRVIGGETL